MRIIAGVILAFAIIGVIGPIFINLEPNYPTYMEVNI